MTINNLLNEASDFSTGEKILDSIKDNQAGISAKKFFGENDDLGKRLNLKAIEIFNRILKDIENFKLDRTKVVKLVLTKSGTVNKLIANYYSIDPFVAYFKNREKKEAKNEYKKLFDDFASSPLHNIEDKNFEKKVNEIFAGKAQVKDKSKEIKQLYGPDKEGWETFIPLTFAAAKENSTTKYGKTKWCTAADQKYFDHYTAKGPLYIVRNYDKGMAYQINFEYRKNSFDEKGFTKVEFMDSNDVRPKDDELSYTLHDVPDEALKVIKNKDKSVLDLKNDSKESKQLPAKPFKTSKIGKWVKKSFHIDDEEQIRNVFQTNFSSTDNDKIDNFFNKKGKDVGQIDFYQSEAEKYIVANSSSSYIKNEMVFDDGKELSFVRPEFIPADLYKIIFKVDRTETDEIIEDNANYTILNFRVPGSNRTEQLQKIIELKKPIKINNRDIVYIRIKDRTGVIILDTKSVRGIISSLEEITKSFSTMPKEDKEILIKALSKAMPDLKSKLMVSALDAHRYNSTIGAKYNNISNKKEIIDTIKKVKENIK